MTVAFNGCRWRLLAWTGVAFITACSTTPKQPAQLSAAPTPASAAITTQASDVATDATAASSTSSASQDAAGACFVASGGKCVQSNGVVARQSIRLVAVHSRDGQTFWIETK